MSVTSPRGFQAAGISCGLKNTGKLDLAIVINQGPLQNGAAVYTSNRAKANPILWSSAALESQADPQISAVVLNSGGANCFTGEFGYETSRQTAQTCGELLDSDASAIQVCSTGLIGEGGENFRRKIVDALPALVKQAQENGTNAGENWGGIQAAQAIMTTDTVEKTATHTQDGWTIGGMAKGAGMLAPGLATMLVVLTTDAVLDSSQANASLREAVSVSFDRLDSDGCMSTNDQVTLMVSGASGVTPQLEQFTQGLKKVCHELAQKLLNDAEGASHDIAIEVVGALNLADALEVGRAVARNNLFKAAIFGNDPNWGRVLAAIGTTQAEFDPYNVDVFMNGIRVCSQGKPDRPRTEVNLVFRQTTVKIDLQVGTEVATIWTNDLTHDYVHENSAYSS